MKFFKGYAPNWLWRIACRHEYGQKDSFLRDAGMTKYLTEKCASCGKVKVTSV